AVRLLGHGHRDDGLHIPAGTHRFRGPTRHRDVGCEKVDQPCSVLDPADRRGRRRRTPGVRLSFRASFDHEVGRLGDRRSHRTIVPGHAEPASLTEGRSMTNNATAELYYDPFDHAIDDDPYPVWRRMRAEAPLYFNDKYNFYALSRYDDVAQALPDWQKYRSGRGTTADVLFSGIDIPPGILLWEDPPLHDLHRRLLSRVFTPRRMLAVEGLVRDLCSRALDPLRGLDGFDFVADLGAIMPMRTIGYLLGIPEEGQQQIRERNDKSISVESGGTLLSATTLEDSIGQFAEYIEWRATHPSDDLMTELLNAQVEEPDGTMRPLDRGEVIAYTAMIAGAGGERTARLLGVMG